MKALTIWQPWASLIMAGAKPFEFRRWDYRSRYPQLEGQQIVIHAGARMPRLLEVEDILQRIEDGVSALDADIARDPMRRLAINLRELKDLGRRPPERLFSQRVIHDTEYRRLTSQILLGVALGTATLGRPQIAAELFDQPTNDSYRVDHSIWAWPLNDVEPFEAPVPMRGAQGFWNWPRKVAA